MWWDSRDTTSLAVSGMQKVMINLLLMRVILYFMAVTTGCATHLHTGLEEVPVSTVGTG